MIVFDIAEWIANLFILGIASLLWIIVAFGLMMLLSILNKTVIGIIMWAMGIFMIMMIVSMINQWVKEMIKRNSNVE